MKMKIVRTSVFETNSSSCHSLTISKDGKTQKLNLQGKVISLNPEKWHIYSGEPIEERVFTSFEDKLNYIAASIWTYFHQENTHYAEVSKEYKDYIVNLFSQIDENYQEQRHFFTDKDGKIIGRFATSMLNYVGECYISDLLNFLEKETGASFKLIHGHGDLNFYDRTYPETRVPGSGEPNPRFAYEWEYYCDVGFDKQLDSPIPLPYLLDRDWVENFLFNDSVKIRIASTSSNNPLDPEIFENPIEVYDEDVIPEALETHEVIIDGLVCTMNSENEFRVQNLNRPFHTVMR